jgi:CPA2 family monovalent cation:H+ antiporter-2
VLHAPGLKAFILFLVIAGIIVPLFHRVRISPVLGFLIAGVLVGPSGLGRFADTYPWLKYVTLDDPSRVEPLAEFGIIVLLFLLGLELSVQRLWQLRRYVLGVGLAQVALSALAIGMTIRLAGAVPPSGLVLGLCLALSSTAIVMQLLIEQHRAEQTVGRVALSVLLLQDMMVVPILFLVGMLAGGDDTPKGVTALVLLFGQAIGVIVAIMLLGRYLVGPLMRSAVRTGSRDLIVAITLLIVVSFSIATGMAGSSVALGAFLAGMLLSGSETRHHIEVDLEPFKGLMLGVFFLTVGTFLDLAAVFADLGWILLAVAALLAIKTVILFAVARLFGVPRGTAIEVALLLAQAGEFAFVVLAQARTLLPPRLAAGATAVVALSMMLTPLLAWAGRWLAARATAAEHRDHGPGSELAEMAGHVVIGGCGRVGRLIAEALTAENVPFVCLDANGEAVNAMRKDGLPAYYGDSSRVELLERIGGTRARAFVVTLNDPRAAERMVASARQVKRDAFIFARAANFEHAARLVKLGAIGVIPETVEASLQLAGRVLEGLDLSDEAIANRMAVMRAAEVERLDRAEMGL